MTKPDRRLVFFTQINYSPHVRQGAAFPKSHRALPFLVFNRCLHVTLLFAFPKPVFLAQ